MSRYIDYQPAKKGTRCPVCDRGRMRYWCIIPEVEYVDEFGTVMEVISIPNNPSIYRCTPCDVKVLIVDYTGAIHYEREAA